MARTKSRYHNKNNDELSSYFFLGIIIISFILAISFLLYNSLITKVQYSDYTHIESYEEILEVNTSRYYVYYYSENYEDCERIESEIFAFADGNDLGVKLYFVDASSVDGINLISGLDTVPTLLVIESGVVIAMTTSLVEITNMIIDE